MRAADDGAIDYSDVPATSPAFWARAKLRLPPRKIPVSIRLDEDVIAWFREQGSRYQTRMNAVLRAYVENRASGSRSRAYPTASYRERLLADVKAAEEKYTRLEHLRGAISPDLFGRVRRRIEEHDASRVLKLPVLFFLLVRRDLLDLERFDALLGLLKARDRKVDLRNLLHRLRREDDYRHAAGAVFEVDVLARLLRAAPTGSVALYPKIGPSKKGEASLRLGGKSVYLGATLLSQTLDQGRIQDIASESSLNWMTSASTASAYGDGLRVVRKLVAKRDQIHPDAPNVICLGLSDLMPDFISVEWGVQAVFSGSSILAQIVLDRTTDEKQRETLQRLRSEARPESRLTGVLVFQVEGHRVTPLRALRNPQAGASAVLEDHEWSELLALFDFSERPPGHTGSSASNPSRRRARSSA